MLKGEPLERFQLSVLKQNLTNYLPIRLPISNRSKKKQNQNYFLITLVDTQLKTALFHN